MDEALAAQIEPLKEAVEAMGWPVLTIPGVEADDVIATLSSQAAQAGWRCVISTGDKDLAQLVDERVMLVNTMSNEKLDIAGVQQKFGVAPTQIVDYLALTGDAVDNVPGVDKVGPKTAAKWIQQYGSLDEVMRHAGEISGVVGENLRKALDWLPKGRSLLTVKRDVALPIRFDSTTPIERRQAPRAVRPFRLQDSAGRDGRRARLSRARDGYRRSAKKKICLPVGREKFRRLDVAP
jgi:DNA polymerase-1